MRTRVISALAFAAAIIPTAALAHPGHDAHGLLHGFTHPFGGFDHLIAMVAVGLYAFQLGGRALWLVPATFVAVMAVAGALGIAGVPLPGVEIGIAASVIVLGAIVTLRIKMPVAIAAALVGVFAVFHGHAHGTEMPLDAAGALYAAGFVTATALLHVAGVGLGKLIASTRATWSASRRVPSKI